jgi:hypothetical protein
MQSKLRHIPYWGGIALLAYMPFHIFLSQWLSLATGGLEAWKIGKDFLTIALLGLVTCLVLGNKKLRNNRIFLTFFIAAFAYSLLHLLMYVLNKSTDLDVALLASTYNSRITWYLLISAGASLLVDTKINENRIIKVVLIVSTIVCLLGLLQWFLPKDLMTHFGYSVERGVKPVFFINEDPAFPRVISTIRDPNSLGTFLIIPILLLTQLITKTKTDKRLLWGLLGLHLLILYLSFSRAALGGFIIAAGVLAVIQNRQKVSWLIGRYWPVLVVMVFVACASLFVIKDTRQFRSLVLRIDDKNAPSDVDSDELHLYSVQKGLKGVADQPFGHGPGTAGIVSIQNESGSFLTENYYIQIAHEIGLIGLALFLGIWAYAVRLLIKKKTVLAQVLVATAVAYAVMALVMHLWTNEAVAAQWWLLAGFAVFMNRNSDNKQRKA